jgi:hypothetical protein
MRLKLAVIAVAAVGYVSWQSPALAGDGGTDGGQGSGTGQQDPDAAAGGDAATGSADAGLGQGQGGQDASTQGQGGGDAATQGQGGGDAATQTDASDVCQSGGQGQGQGCPDSSGSSGGCSIQGGPSEDVGAGIGAGLVFAATILVPRRRRRS